MKKIISVMIAVVMVTCIAASIAIFADPGDCNGDNLVDNKDVVALFRHLSDGKTQIIEENSDYNNDGAIDNKDVVALFRALSGAQPIEGSEEETEPETTEPEEPIPDDAILINNREELFEFAENVILQTENYTDKTIVLTDDIDLDPSLEGGRNWTPMPTAMLKNATIDGRGHTIKNMTIAPEDLVIENGGTIPQA